MSDQRERTSQHAPQAQLPGTASPEQEIESAALVLLWRYGIVFRDLVQREATMPRWRELLGMLRRLEARGIVRGGRFVSGFQGEQFALPQAVESLRESRKQELATSTVTISAADAANLVGIIVPGDRPAAIAGRTVQFHNGHFVAENAPAPDEITALPPQLIHPLAQPAQLALGHD
jgi:ATP-dependent Lhr-like helicase